MPFLELADVKQGAHINAIGSDTPFKQELSTDLCASADLIVTDSLSQCVARGEIHHAIKAGKLDIASVVELGAIIQGTHPGRKSADQTTIADLTGVAVQDIAAAKRILEATVRDAY